MTSKGHPPIVLQLGPHDFAVAVWIRDEGTVPLYEVRHRDIREASVAAAVARQHQEHHG
jgi:hypothetical protein